MEATRKVTSVRQLELLLNFMEQHKDLALGRVRSKEARALSLRLWEECAAILNSEGPFRGAKEWSRFWNDYKSRIRAKLMAIKKSQTGTGGGPTSTIILTPIEERVSVILGRDVGSIPGVQQDPFQIYYNENDEDIEHLETTHQQPHTSQPRIDNQPPPIDSQPPFDNQPLINTTNTSQTGDTSRPPAVENSARLRRPRNPRARQRSTVRQSNREALEESRSAIARIEVMRARTEELLAESLLRQNEVAERRDRMMEQIVQSFQTIAESMDRMSRRRGRDDLFDDV